MKKKIYIYIFGICSRDRASKQATVSILFVYFLSFFLSFFLLFFLQFSMPRYTFVCIKHFLLFYSLLLFYPFNIFLG